MCLPLLAAAIPAAISAVGGAAGVGAITAGVGGASTLLSYFGTQAAHHSAVEAANLNYNQKVSQVDRANSQLSDQESEQALTDAVKQAQSFGQIATSATALGLGQYSTHQILAADAAGANRTLGITDKNYANKRGDLQTELTGASIQRSSEIAAAPRTNLLSLGLSLAGNALSGVTAYGALGGKFGITPASSLAGAH